MGSATRAPLPRLIALSPGTLRQGASFAQAVSVLTRAVDSAASAGLTGLMVREPELEDGAYLVLLRAIRSAFDGWLSVHDRVHLARAAEADGVHLASHSLEPREARRVLGDLPVHVTVSTHDGDIPPRPELVDGALHAPVFEPHSKDATSTPLGRDGLRRAVDAFDVPVFALGGVDAERLEQLAGSSAYGAAVIGGLWGTDATPIDGTRRTALRDVEGIGRRTAALSDAVGRAFQGQVSP